jgi:hypothetical protein
LTYAREGSLLGFFGGFRDDFVGPGVDVRSTS